MPHSMLSRGSSLCSPLQQIPLLSTLLFFSVKQKYRILGRIEYEMRTCASDDPVGWVSVTWVTPLP